MLTKWSSPSSSRYQIRNQISKLISSALIAIHRQLMAVSSLKFSQLFIEVNSFTTAQGVYFGLVHIYQLLNNGFLHCVYRSQNNYLQILRHKKNQCNLVSFIGNPLKVHWSAQPYFLNTISWGLGFILEFPVEFI